MAVGLQVTGVVSETGEQVTWFAPANLRLNPKTMLGAFDFEGYVSQATYLAGAAPVQGMERHYDTGGDYNNVPLNIFETTFGPNVTLADLPVACCQAAIQAQDTPGPNGLVSFFANAVQTY